MHESWSWGVLIGIPLIAAGLIVCSALSFLCARWAREVGKRENYYDRSDEGFARLLAWAFAAAGVLLIVLAAWGFYPFKAEYHKWIPRVGTVTDVDRRIVGGDSINEKIVVTYKNGAQYGCNDTRCASVDVGDDLALTCKRTWQYAGVDGYDCNFLWLTKEGK